MVAHVNMLKTWHTQALRVVVAEDGGEESDKPPSKLTLSNSDLTKEQGAQLAELLSEFGYVVSVDMERLRQ